MSNKTQFNARVRHKTGKYADWEQAANSFKPLLGEIIVYIPDDANDTRPTRLKVGDGEHFINELDFITNPNGGGNAPGGALNQIQSNWNQKDNKQVDFIKNKPFDKEEEILYWDGNLTNNNVIQVDTNMWICKITDTAPSLEELNKTIVMSSADNLFVEQIEITEENIDTSTLPGVIAILVEGSPIMAIAEQDIEYQGLNLSAGTWFFYIDDDYYTKQAKISKIKYLDPEVIPNMYREIGTKIIWDNKPTNTIVYPGYFVEWDGNLLDTKPYISMTVPVDLPNGVPAGSTVQLQKVDEKLISLENYHFDIYYPPSGNTYDYFIEANDIQNIYDSNNNLIATYSADAEIWNVEQPGIINFAGLEVEFIEAGLYFACVPGMMYVTALYDENINNAGPIAWYRVSDPLNILTLHGSKMNVDVEGQNVEAIFTYDAQGGFELPVIDTGTGSSISIYAFNIVNDNEVVDLTDYIGCQFIVPKAGFYIIDIASMTDGDGYINYFLGPDYNIIKIDDKFLNGIGGGGNGSIYTGVVIDTTSLKEQNATNTDAELILIDYIKALYNAGIVNGNLESINPDDFCYSIQDEIKEFYIYMDTFLMKGSGIFENPTIAITSNVSGGANLNITYITTKEEIQISGELDLSKATILRCMKENGIIYGYPVLKSGEIDIVDSVYDGRPYDDSGNQNSQSEIENSEKPISSYGVFKALGNKESISFFNSSDYTEENNNMHNLIPNLYNNKEDLVTAETLYKVATNLKVDTIDAVVPNSELPVQSKAVYETLQSGTLNAGKVNGYRFNVSDAPPVEGEVDDYTITFVI